MKKNKIRTLPDCIDCEKGKCFMVIGAGGTLRQYAEQIKAFIKEKNPVTIGINKMTGFHIPDYHLWTNKQRWRDFGDCIDKKSTLMFGAGLSPKHIKQHYNGDYIRVDYAHSLRKAGRMSEVDYKDGTVYGNFRTAGCLAIVIAHLFGASEIYIVGMDGFTLHPREEIENAEKNQHVYGKGFTDDASWEECVEKDRLVYENLEQIENYGVRFEIITPTVFEKYYNSIL